MANVTGIFKAEVSRISKKETKAALRDILKSNIALKKTVAELKKRFALLEKDTKRLKGLQAKQKPVTPQIAPKEGKRARLTSKGVRALRKKLALKRPDFAKLCGTTAQTVYMWETKDGNLKLRPNTKAAILSLRGIGVREAKKRLSEDQGEAK